MPFLCRAVLIFALLTFGLAEAARGENGILTVDRFRAGVNADGIPLGWKLEKTPGSNSKYLIEREKEDYFLHLFSANDGFGLRKEITFDIRQYPYLSWWWKAMQLPKGGDIRKKETDDQAGQIFVVFPRFPSLINSRSMGYIWDTQAPKGLAGTSPAFSKAKYVVLQSGAEKLNQWVFESRNVYEDYKKYFQEDPPPVGAVLIYINTQHTQTSAEICFTEIFFSARPLKP
ncbi:MAG: uncharacterized protein H6Q43_963 [Deltaproteobacteria bacterium]|jgi:hypothetical protein|nr:uncharacterized protein [Deltaproteobacteria bacterium]MBP1717525.1 uncharacterized protein [Deltaproteobacteria bacterium]